MKLLTHNMLTSHMKGVKNGYPLVIDASKVEVRQVEYNAEFITRMLPRLEWPVVKQAAATLGHGDAIPAVLPSEQDRNEDFLKAAHHVLMEVEILEGALVCPETGRKFPISNGIPNMLLNEDEV